MNGEKKDAEGVDHKRGNEGRRSFSLGVKDDATDTRDGLNREPSLGPSSGRCNSTNIVPVQVVAVNIQNTYSVISSRRRSQSLPVPPLRNEANGLPPRRFKLQTWVVAYGGGATRLSAYYNVSLSFLYWQNGKMIWPKGKAALYSITGR